jgi:nucleotide-binding universal stress UspA family protein
MKGDLVFERVLVPIELGVFDELVLGFVQGMARYGVREVLLLHSARAKGMERAVALRREASSQEEIERLGMPLEADGIKVTRLIASGEPGEETICAADRDGASMIVSGTRGKSALDEITAGSTSESIGRRAKVPVLMLPFSLLDHRSAEDARALGAGLLDSIVFATDFSDVSERCLDVIRTLAATPVGTVHVTHVTSPHDDRGRDGYSVLALKRTATAVAAELMEAGIAAAPNLVFADAVDGVFESVASTHATCIALGSHGRGLGGEMLLGSVSQAVIRKSPIPVLVTH